MRYNKIIGASDENIDQMMQTIFGNPYRKAWFELNFIYHRFISLFDPKRYEDFKDDLKYFLDYEHEQPGNKSEKKMNPILSDIGDTVLNEKTGISRVNWVIANEALITYDVAVIHREINLPKL